MAVGIGADKSSSYLDHLPAVFQQDAAPGLPNFLGRFLLAFEHVLSGLGDPQERGLEEIVAGLHRFFNPREDLTAELEGDPERERERLDWLAGWLALSLREDLDDVQRREFIAHAAPLYSQRGTKQGLERFLGLYSGLPVTIREFNEPFQIGVHSQIGVNTILGGGAPHFFRVTVRVPRADPQSLARDRRIIRTILDQEKPAHTWYTLPESDLVTPVLQIGVTSRIGIDTLLSPRLE